MMRAAAVFATIICLVSVAFAVDQSCAPELAKYCKGVKQGGGKIIACLKKHKEDLSDLCRARVNTVSQYMACVDDATMFCPDMQPNIPDLIACLRMHATDLSMGCRAELQPMH